MLTGYAVKARARILVVDEDQQDAQMVGAVLKRQGYDVAMAASNEEALVKAERFIPDLLVSGVHIDGLSGIRSAAQIAAMLPGCKVLFLSGKLSVTEISRCAPERLVYSFASKPLHPLDLINAIAYMVPTASPAQPLKSNPLDQASTVRWPAGGQSHSAQPETHHRDRHFHGR